MCMLDKQNIQNSNTINSEILIFLLNNIPQYLKWIQIIIYQYLQDRQKPMHRFGNYSKPYFKFFFPKQQLRQSFMSTVCSVEKFLQILQELWYADQDLWKFRYSLCITKNQGLPMIVCSVKRCKFGIRFSKMRHCYKVSYFSNVHSHQMLQFSKFYQKIIDRDPRQKDYRIQATAPLSYCISKRGILPNGFPNMEIQQQYEDKEQKKKVHISFDDEQYQQSIINEPDLLQVKNRSQIQRIKKHLFYDNDQKQYYERQRIKQIQKKQIMKNSYIKITRNRIIKEEFREFTQSNFNSQEILEDDQNPLRIFYASNPMLNNFKKWGKSVYIASIPYVTPKLPNFFIKRQYLYPLSCLVFMGLNNQMKITIFAVGVAGGISTYNDCERDQSHERMIQQFFQLAKSNRIRIQSIMIKENDSNLFNILKGFKERQPKDNRYLLKKQINKRLIVHKKTIVKPGILFKLAYCLLYDRVYEEDNENIQNNQEFDAESLTEIMRKGRKIQPYINKLCVALNPKIFAKLINKFVSRFCKADIHFQYFYEEFIIKKQDYCLLKMKTQFTNKNLTDILVIQQNQIQTVKDKENQLQNNYGMSSQFNLKKNKSFSQHSYRQSSVNMGMSCISDNQSIAFQPSQVPLTSKQKPGVFIGFNLFVDLEQWIKHLALERNLTEKMGQSIVRDFQSNRRDSLPKSSVQLFFRELVLILNENQASFNEPDPQFWRNVGFTLFGSSSQRHKSMKATLRVIPKCISFQTDWDIDGYSKMCIQQPNNDFQKQKTQELLLQLPIYKISLIYLPKRAQQIILRYQILGMLEMNIYLIRISEQKKVAPFAQVQTTIDQSVSTSCRTPVAYGAGQFAEKAYFIVGKQQIYQTVTKIKNKWKCTCNFYDYMGMPCKHILKAFSMAEYSFSDCMNRFWKIEHKIKVKNMFT